MTDSLKNAYLHYFGFAVGEAMGTEIVLQRVSDQAIQMVYGRQNLFSIFNANALERAAKPQRRLLLLLG